MWQNAVAASGSLESALGGKGLAANTRSPIIGNMCPQSYTPSPISFEREMPKNCRRKRVLITQIKSHQAPLPGATLQLLTVQVLELSQ